ncbi:hypothetical protein D3C71_711970 [compost metagenome]
MFCSSMNTARRSALAPSPSVAQSPVSTVRIGSPASKAVSVSRRAAGTGFEVCVAGSANT